MALGTDNGVRQFWRNEDGATAIEYALIGVLLSIAIVGGVTATGTSTSALWDTISSGVSTAIEGGAGDDGPPGGGNGAGGPPPGVDPPGLGGGRPPGLGGRN